MSVPTVRLAEVTTRIGSGITPRGGSAVYKTSGRPFVRSQNVGWGDLRLSDLAYIDNATHITFPATEIRGGDVLLNITGASIGRAAVATRELEGGNVNQHVCEIRLKPGLMDPHFVNAYLLSRAGQDQIDKFQAGGNRQGLNFQQVGSITVPHLPFGQQREIGKVGLDADDHVRALERLITKKQAIKQGMMQQLLTGRTRLPGFTGEWGRLAVASRSVMKARIGWQGLKTDEYRESGTYRLVGGTEFADGRIDWSRTPFVDKWRYDQDAYIQLRPGDVLLTKDGTIGKTAFVDTAPGPATLNSGVFVIRPVRSAYEPAFLFFMLRSRAFDEFLARLSAGSTISHLYQRDLVTLVLDVPPTLDEQRSIAGVLSDADAEIDAMNQRLAKARAIKQGMMQQLLTGRTRLRLMATEGGTRG